MGQVPGNVDLMIETNPLRRDVLSEDMPFIFVVPSCGDDYT